MSNLIPYEKSIIPSCDVSTITHLKELVKQTRDVKGIGGYKIGFELVIPFGMKHICEEIRKLTKLPIIYDHQKAATDTPHTAEKFAKACKDVDAIILFPQAGPHTQEAWIKAVQKEKKMVIVGGEMTHEGFLEDTDGYLNIDTPQRIYELAVDLGVTHFVVPGNKPEKIKLYRELLEARNIEPVFYSPGLVTQGGDITKSGKAAGKHWHAMVGRAIYDQKNMHAAAKKLCSQLGH